MNTPSVDRATHTRRPGLTVAIPTYNGSAYLRETLRSILDQSDVPFDLIVCDDQSTDATRSIVAEIAGDRARLLVNPTRLGLAGNWNSCVRQSETEWVALIHQDDLVLPGHFATQMCLAGTDSSLGLIISAAKAIDPTGLPVSDQIVEHGGLGDRDRTFSPGELLKYLVVSNPVRCSGVTIRASAHESVGGFDPAYRYVVDWDFWSRVCRDWSVVWLAQPTVCFRWHLASETHSFKTGLVDLEETGRLLDRLHAELGADANVDRSLSRRRLARAYLNRAYEASRSGQPALVRTCLKRAINRSPTILRDIVTDPRLSARLLFSVLGGR